MFKEINALQNFYKNRIELSKVEIIDDFDIDDILLKKSFISSFIFSFTSSDE